MHEQIHRLDRCHHTTPTPPRAMQLRYCSTALPIRDRYESSEKSQITKNQRKYQIMYSQRLWPRSSALYCLFKIKRQVCGQAFQRSSHPSSPQAQISAVKMRASKPSESGSRSQRRRQHTAKPAFGGRLTPKG